MTPARTIMIAHGSAAVQAARIIAAVARERADGWRKRLKGTDRGGAWIYTHPDAADGRAVVENHNGITFNGVSYQSIDEAKRAALRATT